MKRNDNSKLPVHDYRIALQGAVSWLGQRYLLAEPVVRRSDAPKPFFTEIRTWFPVRR